MGFYVRKLVLYATLGAISVCCRAQTHLVLCGAGLGSFSSKFTTGVTVTVNAVKVGTFATHTCQATLGWNKDVKSVIPESWEIDIDVLGADLGLNTPAVAFETKSSPEDYLMTYEVYSLEKPPRLLRTITGGDFFSASDIGLEGRNEIWTDDAGVVDGFEGLPLSGFPFVPRVVLRFEKRRLIDVSSEYQPYFDRQIAEPKNQLDEQALAAFKNSDGRLQAINALPTEALRRLQTTKIKVMEIVWSYLYSGREQEAWRALAAMWPPADLDRIRGSILEMQARGIRREVDGISNPNSHPILRHHAQVYNMDTESKGVVDMASGQAMAVAPDMPSPGAGLGEKTPYSVDVKPEPIYLGTPPLRGANQPVLTSKVYLDLVIDAAGKVRSAHLVNESDKGPVGDMLLEATAGWKFIPAFKDGRAVACRTHFGVWPYR